MQDCQVELVTLSEIYQATILLSKHLSKLPSETKQTKKKVLEKFRTNNNNLSCQLLIKYLINAQKA